MENNATVTDQSGDHILGAFEGAAMFIDASGLITGFGDGATATFGYAPDEVLGRPLALLVAASSSGPLQRLAAGAAGIASGRNPDGFHSTQLTAVRSNGTVFAARASVVPVGLSTPQRALVVVRDLDRGAGRTSVQDERGRRGPWEAILCRSRDVAVILDRCGTVTSACGGSSQMLGLEPDELIGRSMFDFLPADERDPARELLGRAFAGEQTRPHEFRAVHDDGTVRWLEATTGDTGGDEPDGDMVINVRDITDRKAAQAATALAHCAVAEAHTAFAIVDAEGRVQFANQTLVEMWGFDVADDLIGRSAQVVLFADRTQAEHCMATLLDQGRCSGEFLAQSHDGTRFDVRYAVSVIDAGTDVPGIPSGGLLLVMSDVSQARDMERNLAAAEARVQMERDKLRHLIERVADAIIVVDSDVRLRYANPSAQRLLGPHITEGAHIRQLAQRLLDPRTLTRIAGLAQSLPHQGSTVITIPMQLDTATGERRVEVTMTNLIDDAAVRGLVVHLRDVTDAQRQLARIDQLASTDELTGLPNRSQLMLRLADELRAAATSGGSVGLLFLDVDRFTSVNDTYGRDIGDDLLRLISDRLREAVRQEDFVARFGGDEFVVLHRINSTDGPSRSVPALAQRILDEVCCPAPLGGTTITPSVSIGVTSGLDGTRDGRELLRDADTALYQAKDQGRRRFVVFTPESRTAVQRRFHVEQALAEAIDADRLTVAYQAIVDLSSGEVSGCEALSRWTDDDLGTISPSEFVPIAEEIGCCSDLGQWVMATVSRDLSDPSAWSGPAPGHVSVNVCARQFDDPQFVRKLLASVAARDIDPSRIVVELTERILLDDTPEFRHALDELRSHGIRLSLDDFGTGYSSMSYLARLPIDILKIDQSFVRDIRQQQPLIEAIIAMARALDMTTIAEGIESVEQLALLMELGCDYGQGFLLARPCPPRAVPTSVAVVEAACARRSVSAPLHQ